MKLKTRMTRVWILAAGVTLTAFGANAAVNLGSSSWVWQNPLPQADNLNGVSCPSATICYAVGDLGTILATTNGGAAWNGQNSTSSANLQAVSCPSTTICVAVGDGGTVLFTNTSGAAWNKQSIPTTAQLTGVSCSSTSYCYAVSQSAGVFATFSLGSTGWRQLVSNSGFVAITCPSGASFDNPCNLAGGTTVAGLHALVSPRETFWSLQDIGIPPISGFFTSIDCPSTSTCAAATLGEETAGTQISSSPRMAAARGLPSSSAISST
jgi:hypothetical protein